MARTHLLWGLIVVSLYGISVRASLARPQQNNYYVLPVSTKQSTPLVRHGRRLVEESGKLDVDGSVHVGYFYAELPLGTPPKPFDVIVDTGSTVTYVPCNDCKHCGTHNDAPFNPSKSPTSSWVDCGDQQCKQLDSYYCDRAASHSVDAGQCVYRIAYAEQSTSEGRLVQDVFTFPDSQTKVPITFGCESGESGEIYRQKPDGLLGMGNSAGAFHSQLAAAGTIPHVFSLCFGFPTGGALLLGDAPVPGNPSFSWTPFSKSGWGDFYSVGLQNLTFAGQTLDIPDTTFDLGYRTVLDSGTTFIYLATPAYQKFADAVVEAAKAGGLKETTDSYGDMCWSGVGADFSDIDRYFPTASMQFAGDAVLSLPPYRYMFQHSQKGTYCLAVFDNGSAGSLIGGVATRNVLVKYDLEQQRVGFADVDCRSLGKLPAGKFTHGSEAKPATAAAAAAPAAVSSKVTPAAATAAAKPAVPAASKQDAPKQQQQQPHQANQHVAVLDVATVNAPPTSSKSVGSSSSSGAGSQGVNSSKPRQKDSSSSAAAAAAYREVSAAVAQQQQQEGALGVVSAAGKQKDQGAAAASIATESSDMPSTTVAVSEDLLAPSLPSSSSNDNSSSSSESNSSHSSSNGESSSSSSTGGNVTQPPTAAAAAVEPTKVYWGTGSGITGVSSTDHSSSSSSSSSSSASAVTVIVLAVLLGAVLLAAAAAVAYVIRRRQIKAAGFSQLSVTEVDFELAGMSRNNKPTDGYDTYDSSQGYRDNSSSGGRVSTSNGAAAPAGAAAETMGSSRDAVKSPVGGRDQWSPKPAAAAAGVGSSDVVHPKGSGLQPAVQQQQTGVESQHQQQPAAEEQQHVAVFSLDHEEVMPGEGPAGMLLLQQPQQQQQQPANGSASENGVRTKSAVSRESMDIIALD